MADNDRTYNYQSRDFGRERGDHDWQRENRERFSERRLDDRTSYGASGDRGYPADRSYRGQTDYGRDDEYGSTYGGYEDRSFSDRDREGSGYYSGRNTQGGDPYGYDRSSYRGSESAREYQTQRPAMRPNYDSEGFGGRPQRTYRGPDQGRESYDFNPYQGYGSSSGGISSEFGFGQWDDERQARQRWENRDRHRGGRGRSRDHDEGFFERMGRKMANWFDGDENRGEYRGEHTGRGPKGYRRSDDRIREDISDRLTDDAWLDASDIEVIVSECEVTLVGTVPDRESKRRAERLAEDISGVKNVQNNLRVSQLNQGTSGMGSASSTTTGTGVIESEAAGVATSPTLSKQTAGRA